MYQKLLAISIAALPFLTLWGGGSVSIEIKGDGDSVVPKGDTLTVTATWKSSAEGGDGPDSYSWTTSGTPGSGSDSSITFTVDTSVAGKKRVTASVATTWTYDKDGDGEEEDQSDPWVYDQGDSIEVGTAGLQVWHQTKRRKCEVPGS